MHNLVNATRNLLNGTDYFILRQIFLQHLLISCLCVFYWGVIFLLLDLFMMHVAIIYVGVLPPTNVRATVLSSRSIQITWIPSTSENVTGYLMSYTTTTPFTSRENVTVNGGSTTSHTLTNLEEGTHYTITVQSTTRDNRVSANSNEVTIMTYTASK